MVPAVGHRQSLELPAAALLVAHLHPGSPRRLAQLPEGGLRTVQAGVDSQGALRLPRLPWNRLEQGVTLLFQNAAEDGSAAERRPPRHLARPDVDLPPTQAL